MGRVGRLAEPITLGECIKLVKGYLKLEFLRVAQSVSHSLGKKFSFTVYLTIFEKWIIIDKILCGILFSSNNIYKSVYICIRVFQENKALNIFVLIRATLL